MTSQSKPCCYVYYGWGGEGRYNYPCTGLDRHLGLRKVEASIIFRQPAHEGGKVASRKHRLPLPPSRHPSYSFHTTEQWFHSHWPRPSGGPWGYSIGSANSHSFAASLAPQACAWLLLLNSWWKINVTSFKMVAEFITFRCPLRISQ